MNNNKDFSEQLGDLFDEMSLDQAGNLIDNEIEPSKKELQEEVIENIKKNDIKIDKSVLVELKEKLGGEGGEEAVMDYLREQYGLKYTDDVKELIEEVGPEEIREDIPEVSPEDLVKKSYVNDLSDRLAKVLSQKGMRENKITKKEEQQTNLSERVDAIHQQLNMLRGTVMEGTMVSGIGQGGDGQTPGSGEVWLHRLNDVDLDFDDGTTRANRSMGKSKYPTIEDGAILIWREDANDGKGGWTITDGSNIGGGNDGGDTGKTILGQSWTCNTFGGDAALYVGSKSEYEADTDAANPSSQKLYDLIQKFDYVVSGDAVEDDSGFLFGTWTVVGARKMDGTDAGLKSFTGYSDPTVETYPIQGVYFRDGGVDGVCGVPSTGEELVDLVVGSITGCNEISAPGNLLWGTNEQYLDLIDPAATPAPIDTVNDENGAPITNAIRVISAIGKITDNGDPDFWEVIYLDDERKEQIGYYPYDGVKDPVEGPFVHSDSSYCVGASGGTNRVTTADVILQKNEANGYSTISSFSILGTLPITDPKQFTTQEQYNEVLFDVDATLHKLKPTIIVAPYVPADPTEETVPNYDNIGDPAQGGDTAYEGYLPIKGDLWLDTNDYTLRACTAVTYKNIPAEIDFSQWVVVSGDGGGGGTNTTNDVLLFNTIALYEYYRDVLGGTISADDFADQFALVTQENANLFNLDLLRQLNDTKPTIHVTDKIFEVKEEFTHKVKNPNWKDGDPHGERYTVETDEYQYMPKKGDIWIDETDYTMYIADYGPKGGDGLPPQVDMTGNIMYPYQDDAGRFIYWIEVGGAGSGGSKVYIDPTPPDNTIEGDLWIESTTFYTYVRHNETWVALTGDQSALGKNFRIKVQNEPPEDPEMGDCWFSLEDTELRIYIINTSLSPSDADLQPGWYPVSSGGIGVNTFEDYETRSMVNFQIQDLNARLQALEAPTVRTESVNNYSYPMSDEQLEFQFNETNQIIQDSGQTYNQNNY